MYVYIFGGGVTVLMLKEQEAVTVMKYNSKDP